MDHTRSVRFPTGHPIGWLSIREPSENFWDGSSVDDAQGIITIPAGKELKLWIDIRGWPWPWPPRPAPVDLRPLAALRPDDLQALDLAIAKFTDTELVHIGHLTGLRKLNLFGTATSDNGLGHLRQLAALEELNIGRTDITDAGLAHLRDLTRLLDLNLWRTRVTDAGLVQLRGLIHLRRLKIRDTGVTEAGLRSLKLVLPHLETYW